VNTSQSLSIVKTNENAVIAAVLARSNETTQIQMLIQNIRAIAEFGGVEVDIPEDEISLPWPAALGSKVVDVSKAVYKRLFGEDPIIGGIHAGLECGEIQTHGYSHIEAVSFGPTILNAHTVEESTEVESCVKFYRLIQGIVIEWAQ
jgi:dipeptidase D